MTFGARETRTCSHVLAESRSYEFLKDSYIAYKEAFAEMDTLICYSVIANSNIAILKSFSALGSGYDIVSVGELLRVK